MPRSVHTPTVVAIACVVYAGSLMLHESAHALTGLLVGGTPTLISSTDVRGDWSAVNTAGITAIGLSGSAVNWMVAVLMLVWLRRRPPSQPHQRWAAWLTCAVNGFVPAMYMVVSPVFGFGDWMTVLRRWPAMAVWRSLIPVIGIGFVWLWWRIAVRTLADELGPTGRAELADALVMPSWVAGGALAVGAALFSPLGVGWAVGIALGSTMGTTWLLLPVAGRAAASASTTNRSLAGVSKHRGWLAAGIAMSILFVGVLGPGAALG